MGSLTAVVVQWNPLQQALLGPPLCVWYMKASVI